MRNRAVTLLITVAALLSQSAGELLITPQDVEAKVGDTTYFNCSTNLTSKEILWNHGDKYVYSENGILPPYNERFEIDTNASIGSYNLVIHSVNHGDAGEYFCIDDDGHGIRRSAQLVVIENDPDCQSNIQPDGVIGQNVFNIPPDEVQLTCAVTYYGNIPPAMEWRNVADNSSTKFNVTSQLRSDNRLTHTLNLKGDISLDKSSYVCQTRRSRQKQYKCSSEVIKVLYVISGNMTELNVFRGGTIAASVVVLVVVAALVVFIAALAVRRVNRKAVLRMREMLLKERKSIKDKQSGIIENVEEEVELRYKIQRDGAAEEKTILGVAILDDSMFLIRKESSELEVYNCKDFKIHCKPVHVEGLVDPLDICSSKQNSLYIMDTKDLDFNVKGKVDNRQVLKINTTGGLLKKWSTKNDACGFLSANKEGNVIITVQDGHMLLEYTSEGKLVRSIDLPACIRPWHAIQRDDGRYIVSHGTYDHLHRVCLVDKKGNVNKSFGDEMGSTANQLHIPYYLAVESSGYVFVADLCNNRVLLLDSKLDYKATVVPKYKQRFKSPRRIYLDEELRVLVVVIGEGIPQDNGAVKSDYPMSSIREEAHDSMQNTEKGTSSKEIHDSMEEIYARTKDHLEEKDDSPRARVKENGVLKIIDKDCRLLVFDIQPLMDNYFRSSTYV